MKRLCAILGVLVLALVGAGTAAAEDGGGAGQAAGQSAASGQSAGGSSGASQYGPTNGATSIRVLSPGNDGAVTQSNTTTAGAIAANANKTSQSTDQSQTGGGYGSPYTQIAGQEAKNARRRLSPCSETSRTAPPHSPPRAKPCTSRRSTRINGAATPMDA